MRRAGNYEGGGGISATSSRRANNLERGWGGNYQEDAGHVSQHAMYNAIPANNTKRVNGRTHLHLYANRHNGLEAPHHHNEVHGSDRVNKDGLAEVQLHTTEDGPDPAELRRGG